MDFLEIIKNNKQTHKQKKQLLVTNVAYSPLTFAIF